MELRKMALEWENMLGEEISYKVYKLDVEKIPDVDVLEM